MNKQQLLSTITEMRQVIEQLHNKPYASRQIISSDLILADACLISLKDLLSFKKARGNRCDKNRKEKYKVYSEAHTTLNHILLLIKNKSPQISYIDRVDKDSLQIGFRSIIAELTKRIDSSNHRTNGYEPLSWFVTDRSAKAREWLTGENIGNNTHEPSANDARGYHGSTS